MLRIPLQNIFAELKKRLLNIFSKYKKRLITAGVILAVLCLLSLIYIIRSPVLVVTDEIFENLYGIERMQRQRRSVSFSLFRRVISVVVADGAGPDIVSAAVSGAAVRPFCVVFPRRYASAAVFYHEDYPRIRSVVLGGLVHPYNLPMPNGVLCVYGTDLDTDLYRAGVFAGILANARRALAAQDEDTVPGRQAIVFWQNYSVSERQHLLFIMGVNENSPDSEVVFINSPGEMPEMEDLACAVLSSSGAEFFDRIPRIPIILFSWLDPVFTSEEVVIMFDDSPWSQIVAAVRLAARRVEEGKIPSKTLIFSGRITDKSVFRILRKSAGKSLNNVYL
ncbi:MAG: hypothetical protein FWG89_06710 [Treponema sp.]|nr:hypothetical protein [Treponema sp.]